MAESNSAAVVWTAIAALALSLSSAAYGIYRAARGPDVAAFSAEDAMLFAYPEGQGKGELGAIAIFDLANTSPDYPDILVSEIIRVNKDGKQVACLGERGEVVFKEGPSLTQSGATPPSVAVAAPSPGAQPSAPSMSSTDASPPAPEVEGAAETIRLERRLIGVLDKPSRAELRGGDLLSRRQLFDQRATLSVVDPCHDPAGGEHYTVERLLADFPPGAVIELVYEAKFAESPGVNVSCSVGMNQRRADLLRTRGHINAACDVSAVTPIPGDGPLSGFFRFWDRIF